jgi:hypothetical protein
MIRHIISTNPLEEQEKNDQLLKSRTNPYSTHSSHPVWTKQRIAKTANDCVHQPTIQFCM